MTEKINHVLFMDDLKLHSENKKDFESLVQTVRILSDDIGMEFIFSDDIGAVLMDLLKAFDCIPDDLLIAKLHAYGLYFDTYFADDNTIVVTFKNLNHL